MTKQTKEDTSIFEKLTPVLLVVVIVMAFFVGVLWQRVANLEGNGTGNRNAGSVTADKEGSAPAPQPPSGNPEEIAGIREAIQNGEFHVRGNRNADVILVEYSDLQCPFCGRFHETAKQAVEEYGDQFAWVYRHFPLDSIHPQAREAAEGAECAADLGGEEAFWSFIDAIFADESTLNDLNGVASSIGLDVSAYESCVESGKYEGVVEADYQSGLAAGVSGTPGNFIVDSEGEVIEVPGAVPFSSLQASIDQALGN